MGNRVKPPFGDPRDEPRDTPVPVRAPVGPIMKWLVRTDGSIKPTTTSPLLTITHTLHAFEELRRRLLVIEDDADEADALSDALAETGYDVTIASDGRQALERVRRDGLRPDAIVLDVLMPVMDGLTFLSARASDPLLAKVPVILLTGHRAAKPPDVFARIAKPVPLLVLLDTVKRALA